ncbi:MAG TPA: tRNA (adenosine(37)-N6)-dimethylallyltransferase MiaA [Candidatus Dormibacteraeota bacterium]|nr:tRNA (adenosine(37)-N6)-dimethylallyltransferase MiaA [Candidatus Dormibacteraeota bacterium]
MAGADAPLPKKLLIKATASLRVPVIVGPTGIGKSRLAFELALSIGGEIVVADSRQVYRRLDIATNKPSPEHRRRVSYHMIDFVDPASSFNAAEYVQGARAAIDDIAARGRVPIVEGGTMLYVDALCDGFSLTGVPPNQDLRSGLARLDIAALQERLLALDPDPGVDLRNPVRVIRAIEILETAGTPLRGLRQRTPPSWHAVRIGVTAEVDVIDRRLEERSREQVRRGLVEETQAALDAGVPATAAVLTGIGYAEALAHLRGELTIEELPKAMAQSNRRYARRQLRWWRKDPRVRWFPIEPDPSPAILKYVKEPE